MNNSYMLRDDGKEIPVDPHPYATDGWPYLLDCINWFWKNTSRVETKSNIVLFILRVLKDYYLLINDNFESSMRNLEEDQGVTINKELTDLVKDYYENLFNNNLDTVNTYYQLLNKALNQEFLRVRYNGLYDSDYSNKEVFFRVSSEGFNWYDLIWEFVFSHKEDIDFITIVTDLESTGKEKYYSYKGVVYNKLPINDFLTQSGNPEII